MSDKPIHISALGRAGVAIAEEQFGQHTERLRRAVNAACICGGKGPDDPGVCPACLVWHRMATGFEATERLRADLEASRAALAATEDQTTRLLNVCSDSRDAAIEERDQARASGRRYRDLLLAVGEALDFDWEGEMDELPGLVAEAVAMLREIHEWAGCGEACISDPPCGGCVWCNLAALLRRLEGGGDASM